MIKIVLLVININKSFNISMILFTVLYKVALTFEPVDEILKCDHSNESY